MTQQTPKSGKAPSKLAPHWKAIKKLRNGGHTYRQIIDYLEQAGVEISLPGLQKYIARQTEIEAQPVQAAQHKGQTASPSHERIKDLRTRLGMTQTEVAKFLADKTMRPCTLRTVQAWESPPSLSSARNAPEWAVQMLSAEVENRGC